MAIASRHPFPNPSHIFPDADSNDFSKSVEVKEYAIGGKLVSGTYELTPSESMTFRSDDDFRQAMKEKIVALWVSYCIQQKLLEVTFSNNVSDASVKLRVHGYLAPDSQVKILRQLSLPKVGP